MTDKPQSASGYSPEWVADVRAACLYVATVLGDLLEEDLVVVGGLVPGMLIAQDPPAVGVPIHPGTMDLDLGLSLGVLDDARYSEIAKRLRQAGFEVHENDLGNAVLQTWSIRGLRDRKVTVDFLISPSSEADRPASIKHLENDFGAVVTPGLDLAFLDREIVAMEGETVVGEWAARDIPVCGPGAFVILKALAFRSRGEPKDAYDLYYTVRNFDGGIKDIAHRIGKLKSHPEARRALAILREDFAEAKHAGPHRAAKFSGDGDTDVVRQDVAGFIGELLLLVDGMAGEGAVE